MKRILLLVITILALTGANSQCILSLRNGSDSTITVCITRLSITHTLAPKETYTCPKVISYLQRYETYEIVYNGITTTDIGSLDSGKYTRGRYEYCFGFDPRFRMWCATVQELKARKDYR